MMVDVQKVGESRCCRPKNREAGFSLAYKSLNTTMLTLRNLVFRPTVDCCALSYRYAITPLADMVYHAPNSTD